MACDRLVHGWEVTRVSEGQCPLSHGPLGSGWVGYSRSLAWAIKQKKKNIIVLKILSKSHLLCSLAYIFKVAHYIYPILFMIYYHHGSVDKESSL